MEEVKPKYCKNKKCVECGTKEKVQHITDAYESDLHGDRSLVYICDSCNDEKAQDL